MNNQFKDLTGQEKIISNAVYVNNNIRQQELSMVLKRHNINGGTRKVRELVNQIRKKGYQSWQNKQWFLIADNYGYSWEQCDTPRALNWFKRINSQKLELTKLQESYLNINL